MSLTLDELLEAGKEDLPPAPPPLDLKKRDHYRVKELYFKELPLTVISKLTGVSIKKIKRKIDKFDWDVKRDELVKEAEKQAEVDFVAARKRVLQMNLQLIDMAQMEVYKRCIDTGMGPSLEEGAMLAKMGSSLHRSQSVDEQAQGGQLTLTLSPQEVLSAFLSDPYMRDATKHIDASKVIDVTDDSNNSGDPDRPALPEPSEVPEGAK